MISHAWKYDENEDGICYNLQVNDIPWNFKRALAEAMHDWKVVSYGWNIKSGGQIFIYQKLFKNEEEWAKWATAFPLEVVEKRFWGQKEKIIKYSKKASK
jgi:hypothetical protein